VCVKTKPALPTFTFEWVNRGPWDIFGIEKCFIIEGDGIVRGEDHPIGSFISELARNADSNFMRVSWVGTKLLDKREGFV
jgi:hypothetical protein